MRADRVVVLPDDQGWLVSRLADFVDGGGTSAVTVAPVGGCGGAGASTLAAGMALRQDRRAAYDIADSLRLPLAGSLVSRRSVSRCINEGLGPVARGRFGAQCGRLLDAVGVGADVESRG